MVSRHEVRKRLSEFVCVRLDWEQMQKHKGRLKVPVQGNQVLLDPYGRYIPGVEPRGKRYPVTEFVTLLDGVIDRFPPNPRTKNDLKLSWFLSNPERQGLPIYVGAEFLSRVDRKPIVTVSGSIPRWLDSAGFLRKHLRQFVWTRGAGEGASELTVRQVEPARRVLMKLRHEKTSSTREDPPPGVSEQLDAAWLDYMKVRPMVARGYVDNPHGNWLRSVLEKVHLEELDVREKARTGTLLPPGRGGESQSKNPTAESRFRVTLPPHPLASELIHSSPFGINTALRPDAPDLEARLDAMQRAGVKWGRQDFTWKRIERSKGVYDWESFDRLVEASRSRGILLFGNLAYAPNFHNPRTPEGIEAYCALASAATKRYRGKVDHWQVWNEPNGGFWNGSPEQYARLLAAAGAAIHEANPEAKVLGLNMAFCDILWAEEILKRVPYECFDIACFHPYRAQCAPEERFDWWMRDQYVKSWHKDDLDDDYPLIRMSFLEQTAELVKVMEKFGKPKPLWITEICWNTDIHPYGVSELRQADLLVRFHLLCIASPGIEKVFWWTLRDLGVRQFDKADMVGLMRADLSPKYGFHAYGLMSRMIEGKRWIRNDSFGPTVYAIVFRDEKSDKDLIVAWATKPYAYVRITNEKGLDIYDVFGTKRSVPVHPVRTKHLPVPLGESPVYVVGARGLKATVRPDPGW